MSDHEPQPEDTRAAEYVLGTLDAEQRVAVDMALQAGDESLAREIAWWEQRLGQLGLELEPVAPPAYVWSRIALGAGISRPSAGERRRRGRRLWQGLATAASLAAVALALVLVLGPNRPGVDRDAPTYASVIRDEPTGAGWLVTTAGGGDRLEVTALRGYPTDADHSLQLWLLPEAGNPIPLGLMPQAGRHEMGLPPQAADALSAAAKLAVSLEPAGGSPTGQPTGEVLWVEPLTGQPG
ncbi:anti-sigma factor [Spectribacter hydrogenooxidans]|uniref:Anti-sigma factor n=1 Tax=Spectribacter hydrogenoxidans TaxID=3075608 RepID=A0ABU3BZP6_9GAMM|nr:anti-sigma factor [Salinisphaera sp. W335]MDT0634787.1 anti-sigma factor [Salinisphaera sp. W335]